MSLRKRKVKVKSLGRVRLFSTPWTVAYLAPQSMEFSRQEYWSGVPDQESSYHFEIRCDHVTHAGQSCGNRSDTAFQGGKKVKVKLLSCV